MAHPDRTAMRLVDLPENPAPAGAICEMVRGSDGVGIRAAHWPALTGRPRGTVCLFQGRSEFIEKYFEVIRDLRARGFAVATFDWRGQGGSDRLIEDARLGHIEDFGHYARDLDAFMRHVALPECPAPFYALAHSMGSAILFAALPGRSAWFERLVATAPMIEIAHVPPLARAAARTLSSVGLSRRVAPGQPVSPVALAPFAGNPVTSDAARYETIARTARAEPRLAIGGPTIGWVRAAFRLIDTMAEPDFGRDWRIPSLVVLAGEDRVVSTPAAERFSHKLRATRAVKLPGALHEVMQERDGLRQRFWAAFDAFVPGTRA
jgi:lysophospholipase